jgi:hypothetical protein
MLKSLTIRFAAVAFASELPCALAAALLFRATFPVAIIPFDRMPG